MRNRQDELEIYAQSQDFDLIAVTETWWDSSHDWNVVRKGYTLFRKDRPGRCGGGVAFNVKQHLECLGVDDECIKNLWVKIKG